MGLDYLNKKVWHPGSMKNIQKVWQEEQKQKEISKRNRERAKKLQEQRHNEQLKRIQVEAGLIPLSHLDRMEWMYDWGNKIQQQQKTNEEFLTGNKKANTDTRKQFKHIFQQQVTNKKCQDFSLLHEDPMFQIQREQKKRRDALVNNPFEMKQIIKQVQRDYLPKRSEEHKSQKSSKNSKHSKKQKKRSKKHKKYKQQRRRSRSRSSSSSSSRSDRSSSQRHDQRQRSRNHKRRQQSSQSPDTETNSKKSKQSSLYKNYLKERFGGILKKQQDGSLKPDYGLHKKKYKTQYQMDEEQRKNQLNKLRQNALKLRQYNSQDHKKHDSESQQANYEQGVANIRQSMFKETKYNRNSQKVKHGSDSE